MFKLSPPVVSPRDPGSHGTMWARNGRWILPEMPDFHIAFRDLLHAVNLRHEADGFTPPPKEGVLRIFSPWKIRRLRPGLNPRTWVPKASTLPLDHRSHSRFYIKQQQFMLAALVLSRGQSGNYLSTPHTYIQTSPQQFIFMHLWLTLSSWMKRSSDCTKNALTSGVLTSESKFVKAQIMDLI
jgi:hypothetical protein